MRPEIRDAANKELFDEWLEVIAERTGTDPDRDIYPRLVSCRRPCRRRRGDGALCEGGSARVPITTLIRAGFAEVAAGLPEPARSTRRKK